MQEWRRPDHIYSKQEELMRILALVITFFLAQFAIKIKPVENLHIPFSKPTPVEEFMDRVAEIETPGGGYKTVNRFGMLGRYQFSPSTIKVLGFRVNRTTFLNTPALQDSVMLAYMTANERELEPLISKYNGRRFKGIKITRAAILAGAHFAGSNGVRAFFTNDSHEGTKDAFGTSLRKYMSEFSDFHLPPIVL